MNEARETSACASPRDAAGARSCSARAVAVFPSRGQRATGGDHRTVGLAAVAAVAALSLATSAGAAPPPAPAPHILVFGGGSDPASTQLSIETHVLAIAEALAAREPTILFAGGRPEVRTVQMLDEVPDRAGDWLGRVLRPDGHVGVAYRGPRARGGAASEAELLGAITRLAASPQGVIVFGAGHGVAAEGDTPMELALWGPDTLTTAELAGALDKPTTKGPVALVLGQCHSGAFTDVAHARADRTAPRARPTRCVLAAAPADRTASGCTPDATDPGARAYLALFAEALAPAADAKTPRAADFDRDGKVSLAEAHAHATLRDDTIDLPVKTSEAWVRSALGAEAERLHQLPHAKVLQLARPEVRAILDGLRPAGTDATAARAELDGLRDQHDAIDDELEPLYAKRDAALERVRLEVLTRWPELSSPYHRLARALLGSRAEEILRAIEASPDAETVLALDAAIGALELRADELERASVKIERWLRAVDTVALEAALAKRGGREQLAGLAALLACEAMVP